MSFLTSSNAATQQLSCNPSDLHFGKVIIGTPKTLSVTMTNGGSSSVTVTSMTNVAGFTINNLKLPFTLNAGQSTTFNVVFNPTTLGRVTGTVAFNSSAAYLNVYGVGVNNWSLTANPASLAFGSVQVGNSSTLPEVITNSSGSSITISQASITGAGFTYSGLSLPLTLSAGQSYTFSVTFAPQAAGSVSGNLLIGSDPLNPNLTVRLTGTGGADGQLAVSPASINFGNVNVGSSSNQTGTLAASGASVTITSATSDNSQFTVSGLKLPLTIAAGQSTSYTATFAPQSSGASSATLTFVSNATNSPTLQSLTGTGTAQQHSVALTWDPSTSQVIGYNVYRSNSSGGNYTKINSTLDPNTAYTDTSVSSGKTYYYATTAVDSQNMESTYSNQVQVSIP